LNSQHRSFFAAFFLAALTCRCAFSDAYDPPANYYNTATGTGATLKQQLNDIIDNHTVLSYDAARANLQVSDSDPAQPGHMITVYDRTSLNVSAINPGGSIPGWDSGATWNREHTWPRSRGIGSSGPDDSDMFELRPALTSNNGDRGDLNFGGAFGAQSWGTVSDGGQTYWYPGDADAGMIARQEFYMATRYDGTDGSTQNLEIGTGNVANPSGAEDAPPQLGNLTRLLEWHYAAVPDTFERRRNQIIYDQFQHNRNPFTDHPEYVWSVFVNQANNSQVSIAGATVNADGSSAKTIDMGRVFVNGAVPALQVNTLNKTGTDGTYYSVATTGFAASSVTGQFNAFAITTGGTLTKSINVGIASSIGTAPNVIVTTATAGVKTGTVVVDNLDITAGGGTGTGANDGSDTFNLSLNVLDHMTPSFTSPSLLAAKTLDFGNIAVGSTAPTLNFNVFDLNGTVGSTANMDFDSFAPSGNSSAFTTNLAAYAGALQIAAGTSQAFTAALNLTSVGTFTATYTLNFSDENLTGAQNKSLTLTLTGKVRLAGDFDGNGIVDAGDYVVWQRSLGQSVATAYAGADGDGNSIVDSADFDVWRAHFGDSAQASGASLAGNALVPEPGTMWLFAVGSILVCRRSQRTRLVRR
jgi:endonuclease I